MNSRACAPWGETSSLIFLQSSIALASLLLQALIFLLHQSFERLEHTRAFESSNDLKFFQVFSEDAEICIRVLVHVRIVSSCVRDGKSERMCAIRLCLGMFHHIFNHC